MSGDIQLAITTANAFGNEIQDLVINRGQFPSGERNVLLMGHWSTVFEIHRGMLCLFDHKLWAPGFTLGRPLVESAIRAHVAICGTPEDIAEMHADTYRVNFKRIGEQVDVHFGTDKVFNTFLNQSKDMLHSFAHGGVYQLGRRFSGNDLIANYSDVDVLRFITLSTTGAFLVNNIATKHLGFDEEWKCTTDLYAKWNRSVDPIIQRMENPTP